MSQPLRVLLLEDSQNDARLILHELRQAGFELDWTRVETEPDFVALLDPAPNLILADYSLPQFDALRALHLVQERGLDVPVIVVTGALGDEAAVECVKQGASDYLLKDRLARLGQAVTHALDQKLARQEKQRAEEALRDAEKRMTAVLEHVVDGIITIDERGIIESINPAAAQIFGYQVSEVLGRNVTMLMPDPEGSAHDRHIGDYLRSGDARIIGVGREVMGLRSDGTTFPMDLAVSELDLNGKRLFTGIVRDITERKRVEERLTHQAKHDPLTGLPNRARLQEKLEQHISSNRAEDARFAVLLLDLDHFKEINDTFGHDHGDAILRQLGPRLTDAVRELDMIARLGGDEFAVLLTSADENVAVVITERILASLQRPIMVHERQFDVRASIGIALYPDHGQDVASLLQSADVAMYAAKRSRSEWAVYSADTARNSPRRLSLVGDLRRGIASGQLLLHYQPKVDLKTMQPDGAEALVRWQHPRDGLIAAVAFIPLAERTGLIRQLDLWTLKAALHQCHDWHQAQLALAVAVNLAPDNLQDDHLVETIVELLDLLGAAPAWLTVELTETALMVNPARTRTVLQRVHELGVKIAIDDFGTGYSSLGCLKMLPVDEVKVDQTFVRNMAVDAQDARVVRSVIDLGHDLGMRVVAEGVEAQSTLDLLAAWGCDLAQGYYFSRPLSAPDFTLWMATAKNTVDLGSDGPRPWNGNSKTRAG